MSMDNDESESDSDPTWDDELICAIRKKESKSKPITEQDRINRIQECLDEGANIDAVDKRDKDRNTALHFAVKKGYEEVAKYLVEKGALTDIPNKSGNTVSALVQALGKEDILNASTELNVNQDYGLSTAERSDPSVAFSSSSSDQGASTSRDNAISATDSSLRKSGRSLKRKAVENERIESSKRNRCESTDADMLQIMSEESSESEEEDNNEISRSEDSVSDGANVQYAASGSKQTVHGNIYQLKLLMLFVTRGLQKDYEFRLATEMEAAEKFDDVVFRYKKGSRNGTVCRYLQAKHRQDESRKIIPGDLLNEKDGDFSLQKYFVSYRKIKKHPELSQSKFEDCILCTNVDIDSAEPKFRLAENEEHNLQAEDLDVSEIGFNRMRGSDPILDVKNSSKKSVRYKLVINDKHDLHELLKKTADANVLAKTLAEHVLTGKKMTLSTKIFKLYHIALSTTVIDVKKKRFLKNFEKNDENLSADVKNFRMIFCAEFLKLMKLPVEPASEDSMWLKINKNDMKLSGSFGESFKPKDFELSNCESFSEAFVELIRSAENDRLIKIDRESYKKTAEQGSDERIIGADFDKLAQHVLIVENKEIKFNPEFFVSTSLPSNMEEFRNTLKKLLDQAEYDNLKEYRFEVKNSPQHWDLLYAVHELPKDKVETEEIHDFFKKLVLAVNQPDEVELGKIIRDEIGEDSRFNSLSANLVSNSFLTEMLDWFKKKGREKGKEGIFFTAKDGKDFFESMEKEIDSLIVLGIDSSYSEVLKEYEIHFTEKNQELEKFLNNEDKQVLHLTTVGQTLPTVIKVHRIIQESEKYQKDATVIFIQLRTLLPEKNKKLVIGPFGSLQTHKLLVIDCESSKNADLQGLYTVYAELRNVMKNTNSTKKLILISPRIETNISFADCDKMSDEVKFCSLAKTSREKLLNKKVINVQQIMNEQQRQESQISFQKLLGNRSSDYICTEMTDVVDAIDSSTLVDLICDNTITLGDGLEKLDEESYYINREFNHIFLKEDVFKHQSESDVVAVSGIDKKDLQALVTATDREKIKSYEEFIQQNKLCKFIILDQKQETDQFKKVCEKYSRSNCNFHRLKYESGNLVWEDSYRNNAYLLKYRDINKSTTSHLTENELVGHPKKHKWVMIADNAGMGKTTVFTSLARRIKRMKPDLWVIRIDLNNFESVLAKELARPSFRRDNNAQVIKFFVENLSNLKTDLDKKVLSTIMSKRDGGVVLLVDGFDEICPNHKKTVINLLQGLQDSIGVEKLFVSTRPHMNQTLGEKLKTFFYTMKPFSMENQIQFLMKFWQRQLGENNIAGLKKRAEMVIEKFTASIADKWNEFAGIPLQTRMIAEIFMNTEEDEDPILPEKMNIVDLYERFVMKKFDFYCKEKKKDNETLATKEASEELYQSFLKRHKRLAVYTLCGAEDYRILPNEKGIESVQKYITKIRKGKERTGIITNIIDGKPRFIHRSFAEYFAATLIFDKLKVADRDPDMKKFIVGKILLQPENNIIRAFLNELLSEVCLLDDCLYDGDTSAIGSWKLLLEENRTKFRETIFHIAVKERNDKIVKFFLTRLGEKAVTSKFLNEAKDRAEETALYVAASGQHWDMVKLLVDHGGASVNYSNLSHRTPLHQAAFYGNLAMVKWLVKKGAKVDAESNENETPVHWAARSDNLDVLEYLMDETEVDYMDSLSEYGFFHNFYPKVSEWWRAKKKGLNKNITKLIRMMGDNYKVMLLKLFLIRMRREGYPCRYARDMDRLGYFGDVVLEYDDLTGSGRFCRLFQFKHTQEKSRKISVSVLLSEAYVDFSLQKYFTSYRKLAIKEHPELKQSELKDCIVWTNIDFDHGELGPENIHLQLDDIESDFLLDIASLSKESARLYRFVIARKSPVRELLKKASDIYILAERLAERVLACEPIMVSNDYFKNYHVALASEVIDIRAKKFATNFIKGCELSDEASEFRRMFIAACTVFNKRVNRPHSEIDIWEDIQKSSLKLSAKFGEQINDSKLNPKSKLPNDIVTDEEIDDFLNKLIFVVNAPSVHELRDLMKKQLFDTEFSELLRSAKGYSVKVQRVDAVTAYNIKHLIGSVLVAAENDGIYKFESSFLDDNIRAPDNIKELKNSLKAELESDWNDLARFRFQMIVNTLDSGSELPIDIVNDEKTDDFLTKLIFVVNESDVDKLNELMRTETGESSELLNLLSTGSIQFFLYQKKGRSSGLLKREEGGVMNFRSVEQEGISSTDYSYLYTLNNYGIEFEHKNQELTDFLDSYFDPSSNKPALKLIATGKTLPTTIRVQQYIQKTQRYKEIDSLIFIHLQTELKPEVIRDFGSYGKYDLLVIEDESANKEYIRELCDKFYVIMKENSAKKLILITPISDIQTNIYFEEYKEKHDEVGFNNLVRASQQELLEKQCINFQGKPMSFSELLGERGCEEYGRIIDLSTLVRLIRGDNIIVGDRPQECGYFQDWSYLNRTIDRQVFLKIDILRYKLPESDVLAISGIDKGVPGNLVIEPGEIGSVDEIDSGNRQSYKFIILDSGREREQFEELCLRYTNHNVNVHWVMSDSKKLIWKQSQGSIATLSKYRDTGETTAIRLTDDELADLEAGHKVIIIADNSGTGKTTTFTFVAMRTKERKPDRWVIRIDLNNFREVLKELQDSPSFDSFDDEQAVDIVVKKLANLRTNLEKMILEIMFKNHGKVVLLFDSIDAVSRHYKDAVIALLHAIKNSIGVKTLFVSSRPHMRTALEENLGVFSYTMTPLNVKKQIHLLRKFWRPEPTYFFSGPKAWSSEEQAKELIAKYSNSIDDQINDIVGIPLQLKMIAEISEDTTGSKLEAFESCEEFLQLRRKVGIVDLYRCFVRKKDTVYYMKKTRHPLKPEVAISSEMSLEDHQVLALYRLFSTEDLTILLNQREMESKEELTNKMASIIKAYMEEWPSSISLDLTDDKPQLIHRTLAEYFTAIFLTNILRDGDNNANCPKRKFIVEEILLQPNYNIIRAFMNGLLLEVPSSDRNAVGNTSVDNRFWRSTLSECRNELGETIFHITAQEGHFEISKFLLTQFGKTKETGEFLDNAKDNIGQTALDVAALHRRSEMQKLLEEYGATQMQLQTQHRNKKRKYSSSNT